MCKFFLYQARHHLAASTQILMEHQKNLLKPSMTDDEKKSAEEDWNHRLADVNRCWIKYALNLMSDSRDRLLRDGEEEGIFSSWSLIHFHFSFNSPFIPRKFY